MTLVYEDLAEEEIEFYDVDDVNLDGRITVGTFTSGLEIDELCRVVGASNMTEQGRTIYSVIFIDAVLTFSARFMARADFD